VESICIKLEGIEDVKQFVNRLTHIEGEFDLIQGKYVVDAKSILGIFSLDLEKPMELKMYSQSELVKKEISTFITQ